MKSPASIRLGISAAALTGLVLGISVAAFRAKADVWDKKTILTAHQPIQVEETYLGPGTYVFKLLDSSSNRHIVQIFNRDQNQLINTILAIPNYRVQPTGNSQFSFYETPPGTARAMRAWFYPGDNYGQEFRYPKQLRQIAMAVAPAPAPVDRPPEPPPPPIVTKPAEPEPSPQPSREEEPVEVAQSKPPPAPEAAPAPEPAKPAEPPAELPKTATPFPLMGLAGVVSLAAYAWLRIKSRL